MTTGFQVGGSDVFDTWFEPYTAPYSNGVPVNYTIANIDLRNRYLQFGTTPNPVLGNFAVDTSGNSQLADATKSSLTNYQAQLSDLKNIFAYKGSVKYAVVVPISGTQLNLDTQAAVKAYLLSVAPSFYDASYSYFNANTNTGAGFSTGNPSIILWIKSGAVVYSNNPALAALNCTAFPSGVFFKILNQGTIVGCGGAGALSGANGTSGGPAISLSYPTVIDNSSGDIWGGGGGAGGGGPAICIGSTYDTGDYRVVYKGGTGGNGATGYGGTPTAAGTGVLGAGPMGVDPSSPGPCNTNGVTNWYADWGGNGGDYGALGGNGYATVTPYHTTNYIADGVGGAAGNGVTTNGKTLTWLGGNTSPHLKGAVV